MMIDASAGATTIINEYYDENLPFLSDLFTIENDFYSMYVSNESNETSLENVSVVIDFVKEIPRCHKSERTGFANINKIKR